MNRILKASSLLLLSMTVAASSSLAGKPEAPAVPHFEITPNHKAHGGDREIQAFAAELIGRQAEKDRSVPDGRVRHFSWITKPSPSRVSMATIVGWRGSILDQSMLPSGLRVRVRVTTRLGGGCTAFGRHTEEAYLITDGVAHLTAIAYSDPKRPLVITFN